jgi:hypothetical protein
LHHLPSDREGSALYRLYPQAQHRRRRFTWTTPPSHPVAPTPSFSSSQLLALPCSPSLTSARLRAINLSPIRSSPSYHHHFTDSPCRSANGYCTGRLCYPPSGAGRSPSARRRRRPAGAPADAPSELKVLPRPQIPPPAEN